MLKVLLFAIIFLLPKAAWTQHPHAIVDYEELTDSLFVRWGAEALVDSIYAYHWKKGLAMVERLNVAINIEIKAHRCSTSESEKAINQKLQKLQQGISDYEVRIFNTAIPALKTSLKDYLKELAPQFLQDYGVANQDIRFFDTEAVLYKRPDVKDLTQAVLAHLDREEARRHCTRFQLYAGSRVVSLGLR